ncbi:MAG: hypothetical protein QY310_09570 [Candidatus Jettenia sp. CY-1]|nr:MAG: hypothetical protein QY310_09570 [Candidatus Jettenia sp. CY-1]
MLSSRGRVTSHSASFVYNYGDFRGNPEQLMRDYFGVMLYIANWGARRLMFRIPQFLIDVKKVGRYCISDEINKIAAKEHVILDLNFHDEELAEWTEGEGWLDELVGLREELFQGDFRMLYLAWLKVVQSVSGYEGIDADTLEPPVPAGLNKLSDALKSLVRFFGIDEAMLAIAAQRSEDRKQDLCNKQKDKQRKAEFARKRRLEVLGEKENKIWQQVESLIEEKKPKSYDSVLALLKDLRELAEYRGKLEEFKERLTEIQQTYSNRPALQDRIRHAKLI